MSVIVTAEDIDSVVRSQAHGPLELILLGLTGDTKTKTGGRDLLLRLHFPVHAGGVEVTCHHATGWRTWLASRLLRRAEAD